MENKREEILSRLEAIKQEKKQLKKQLNDLPSLEVGKWYKNSYPHLFFCQYIDGDMARGYGFKMGEWEQNKSWCIHNGSQKPATDKEVETALIAEAKKRGFKEGVKFRSAFSGDDFIFDELIPCYKDNQLWMSSTGQVFKKGKWAEIIKPKTVHIPSGDYNGVQLKDILNNLLNEK